MKINYKFLIKIPLFFRCLLCIVYLFLSFTNMATGQAILDPRAKYSSGLQLNLSEKECIKVAVELNQTIPYSQSKTIQQMRFMTECDMTPPHKRAKIDPPPIKVHLDLTYFFLWNNDQVIQVLAYKYKPTTQQLERHKTLRKFNLAQFLVPEFKEVQQKLLEQQQDSVLQVYSSTDQDSVAISYIKMLPACTESRIKSLTINTLHQLNFPLIYKANANSLPEYFAIMQVTSYKLYQADNAFLGKTYPVPLFIPDYLIQAARYTHEDWIHAGEGRELLKNTVASDPCFINYSFFPAISLKDNCFGLPQEEKCNELKNLFSVQTKTLNGCAYAFTVSNGETPAYYWYDLYKQTKDNQVKKEGWIKHNYFIVPGKFFIPYRFKVNAVNDIPWAKYKSQNCIK